MHKQDIVHQLNSTEKKKNSFIGMNLLNWKQAIHRITLARNNRLFTFFFLNHQLRYGSQNIMFKIMSILPCSWNIYIIYNYICTFLLSKNVFDLFVSTSERIGIQSKFAWRFIPDFSVNSTKIYTRANQIRSNFIFSKLIPSLLLCCNRYHRVN